MDAFWSADITPEELDKLGKDENLLRSLRLVLQEKARIIVSEGEPSINELIASLTGKYGSLMVSVDRKRNNQIDPGVRAFLVYPELEHDGPLSFNLADVELLLHEMQKPALAVVGKQFVKQKPQTVTGHEVFAWIKQEGRISDCFSLLDGEAIRDLGLEVYKERFGSRRLPLWKSTGSDNPNIALGRLSVPCLCVLGSDLVILWVTLDNEFTFSYTTPCHPRAKQIK